MIAISGCKKKETYTVTFNANGGTGTMAAQTFTEGEAQTLTRNAFTYDGYAFSGWNTVQSGSGASYTDGQTITAIADMTLYAQWTSNGTNPTPGPDPTPTPPNTLNGHEFVDLGLPSGLLWATCNVGATTPDGYGDYFAWGETTTKETYSWSNYKYCNGAYNNLTKYCDNTEYGNNGFTDDLTTLEASDDAATANWGAGWRMPTREEMSELGSNCTYEWTTRNDINGILFTSRINGNSIFLPIAGVRYYSLSDANTLGYYWSSSLTTNSDSPEYGGSGSAWCFYFFFSDDWGVLNNYIWSYFSRSAGRSVRAVCSSQN